MSLPLSPARSAVLPAEPGAMSPDELKAPRAAALPHWVEFLLVGGGTLIAFPLSWWLQQLLGLDRALFAAGFFTFHAAYVLNDPHFSITYLLFYQDVRQRAFGAAFGRAQRIRYWVAGFLVPALLLGWSTLALALPSAPLLGGMIQLMFLLVGWHYVKQGFGVLTVLCARRGVLLSPTERRVLLFHCFAGWGYAWANPAVPAGEYVEKGVVYWAVAHPRWFELLTAAVLAGSALALAWVLAERWRRERQLLPLAPLLSFLVTIWSWTIYSRVDPFVQYLIPALHSLQYFYFVWLMQSNRARSREEAPFFGRPVRAHLGLWASGALGLGWLLFRGAPTLLDELLVAHPPRGASPEALGPTPFFAVFFVAVNLHHYFMDHVIWRRENPDTRFLRSAAG
ncbi:MAG: hypothetical protein RL033_3230 [Pseudomonadota bacterium]|jgi:hypothetical protein